MKLAVDIGRLVLQNPIMPASGTFGPEMADSLDFNQIGALVPKSITKYPRPGNPTPRVCETSAGMINSIGIQSKGIEYYEKELIPQYAKYSPPLIPSISADSIEEFAEMSARLGAHPDVAALELNISCPNLKGNGLAFGMEADTTYTLMKAVRHVTDKPVIPKLTPNVTSIQTIAKAAEEAGADALNVANTMLAMAIDVDTWKPKIGQGMGGFSGPATKPVIVRLIYQTAQAVNIPIIGCGGIMNGEDVIEMMLAGASAVQVGTASFIQPDAMIRILEEVKLYMSERGIDDIHTVIGAALPKKAEEVKPECGM
ncbi:dihydroorotate dehydrogenase [Bacillaceae bacterium SIJ1]|uniref:dihydroorotate dehydrogenase n=1 Tax=Litoribacterium kuwaitense TaxID=1398745 RepID=UPI0013ECE8F2|nr:dihydroorotate dehydrogenase [Litoribacterium kuwaitense]NGP44852.1 dihydroorotate dehydrogenase [Litoribacterium kuwaitense]